MIIFVKTKQCCKFSMVQKMWRGGTKKCDAVALKMWRGGTKKCRGGTKKWRGGATAMALELLLNKWCGVAKINKKFAHGAVAWTNKMDVHPALPSSKFVVVVFPAAIPASPQTCWPVILLPPFTRFLKFRELGPFLVGQVFFDCCPFLPPSSGRKRNQQYILQ